MASNINSNILHQYAMCPLCKNLIYKFHIQYHYKECKERDEERKIKEELQRQTNPHYRFQYLKQKNDEYQRQIFEMKQKQKQKQPPPPIPQTPRETLQTPNTKEKTEKIAHSIVDSIFPKNQLKKNIPEGNQLKKNKIEIVNESENVNVNVNEEVKEEKEEEEKITVDNYRPPPVTTAVSIYHETVMTHFFMLYEKLFYEYVKGKTIALVGPAESILNTNRGHIIDKFDIVVRLNKSIPLPKDISHDIGTRTDILYNSLNRSDFPGENKLSPTLHKKYGIKFVCSSYPFNGVFKDDIAYYVRKYQFELPFKVMDEKKFQKFEVALGTRPYTGTCAIMDLLSYPIKYLYITGLDFYYSKYYSQYREISKGQLKHTRNSNIHNAKPQLNYLKHIALLDDRIILDGFLTRIVFEDYDKVWKNMKNIPLNYIFGFSNDQMKQYFEMKLCKIILTKEPNIQIKNETENGIENNDKPLFILTNQSYGIQFHENQYILFLTQNKKDIKKLQDNGIQNVVGNFYFTNQQLKETPTVFLHQRFLHEMKNILLRLNMKNPSLYFLLFFAILLYFPDDSIFLESDINLFVTNLEERKLFNYLMRKKYVKIHKSS